jgi:hypothetical protein
VAGSNEDGDMEEKKAGKEKEGGCEREEAYLARPFLLPLPIRISTYGSSVHLCVFMHMNVFMFMYVNVCLCMYVYVCMFMYICVCVDVCLYVDTQIILICTKHD